MKVSTIFSVSLIAGALAAPAVVTVTKEAPPARVTVQAVVNVEDGGRQSSLSTLEKKTKTKSQKKTKPTPSTDLDKRAQKKRSNLSEWQQKMLDQHNKKRELHKDTDGLVWNDNLAILAQSYADRYDCSGNLAHNPEFIEAIGENLAVGYDDIDAIDAWYDEIQHYDYSNPVHQGRTAHFTQLVWKDTKNVGCAYKTCGGDLYNYIVCEYDPAGNWAGEFADNVKPLK